MIEERQEIKQKVIVELGDEIAKAKTLAMRGCPFNGEEAIISDSKLEQEALRLEQVKITQQIDFWRDVKDLKKEIMDLEEKLDEIERQNEILKI